MSPAEARYAALRSFDGLEQAKESSRNARGWRSLADLWQDLCYGTRIMLKKPGFSLVVILTLALGIGVNTAIFSVVYSVLLRPLPYEAPEQLMAVYSLSSSRNFTSLVRRRRYLLRLLWRGQRAII